MRLRQACCHPQLVKGVTSTANRTPATPDELKAAQTLAQGPRVALLEKLLKASDHPCALCGDIPDDPVVAVCECLLCRSAAASPVQSIICANAQRCAATLLRSTLLQCYFAADSC